MGRQASSVDPLAFPIATSSSSCGVGMKGSGWRGSGTLCGEARGSAGAYLEIASYVSSNWLGELVGSQFACRSASVWSSSRVDLLIVKLRAQS